MIKSIAERWRRFNKSAVELDAEDLRAEAEDFGADTIDQLVAGQVTTLTGVLRSMVLRPSQGVQVLEADLYDGTGLIQLRWLGRRKIRGVNPGTQIAVTGRIVRIDGQLVMFNPNYTLQPKVEDRD